MFCRKFWICVNINRFMMANKSFLPFIHEYLHNLISYLALIIWHLIDYLVSINQESIQKGGVSSIQKELSRRVVHKQVTEKNYPEEFSVIVYPFSS